MVEFWERFAYYGMKWALTLYIVQHFYAGQAQGEKAANQMLGSYLALVYASGIFGGYVADRLIGYQRAILIGAAAMAAGLFLIAWPENHVFQLGLTLTIIGNGLFKSNISSIVGQLYAADDTRRDRGFTIFYMGINAGSLISPLLTGWFAESVFGTPANQNYQVVFLTSAIGLVIGLFWFYFGRRTLHGLGNTPAKAAHHSPMLVVTIGFIVAIPLIFYLLTQISITTLLNILCVLFVGLSGLLIMQAKRLGRIAMERVIGMLIFFVFNITFWMLFEQAGSSFTFLAAHIVDRQLGGQWEFPVGWFQAINPIAILILAPIITIVWTTLNKRQLEPSLPWKFALGLLFNSAAFLVLIFALSHLVDRDHHIPFWTLVLVYVVQTVGELCLSPIGLSMVTKLAPGNMIGLAVGGWFLSIAIGDNLSGIFASIVSGDHGMTIESAQVGYTFGFWSILIAGLLLIGLGPLINRLMHGIK